MGKGLKETWRLALGAERPLCLEKATVRDTQDDLKVVA